MSSPNQVRLVAFYFRCAQLIEANDISQANKLIAELRQHSSAIGNAEKRMTHYFLEALVSLLTDPHYFAIQLAAVENSLQLVH
jgi:indole-3-glycerol phosphate synthase